MPPWSDARYARLVKYLDADLGQYEIAKLMGCSQSSVSRAMARIGRSPPTRPRRTIEACTRPKKTDRPKTPRLCIGSLCRDKADRSFMSNGPGNRMCQACNEWADRNGAALV